MEIILIIILFVILIIMLSQQSTKLNTLSNQHQKSLEKLEKIQKEISLLKPVTQTIITPLEQTSLAPVEEQKREEKPISTSKEEEDIAKAISNFDTTKVEVEEKEEAQKEYDEETIEEHPSIISPIPTIVASEEPIHTEIQQPIYQEPKPSWFARFRQNNPDFEKFIGENLINKIGILILVLGISFFVKYAIDKDWINEPARVGIGILCGALLLFVAHRLRLKYAAFSSIFVAGAIAVFYFTIGIAYHDYHLFNQTTAFVIMVVITAFSTFVSLAYNRQELIILSLLGGFAVPFMVSNGSGNYHALFIYLIILNVSMLVISYYKRWFLVNFIAFILTIGIYTVWHSQTVFTDKAVYNNALLYCSIFYIIFSIVFILHSVVRKTKLLSYEVSAFVLNAAMYYGLGMSIFHTYIPNYQGIFTLGLAAYNMLYAFILFRKYRFDYQIIYILIGLALTFATITIPVQFNGNYITILWAAEAVLLFWLAKKSALKGFGFVGIIVQFLAVISLLIDWERYTVVRNIAPIFLNRYFITGLTVVASLFVTNKMFKSYDYTFQKFNIQLINTQRYRIITQTLALILGYLVPLIDIIYYGTNNYRNDGNFWIFINLFHIVYTTVCIYFGLKKDGFVQLISRVVIGFNVLLYLCAAYRIPIIEHEQVIFTLQKVAPLGFIFHYVALIGLIFQIILLVKQIENDVKLESFKRNILPWTLGFVLVYMLSVEANVLIWQNTDNSTQLTAARNLSFKVVFPILWGVISFGLLIYGIRKNLKMERIVALSLLGITIIKLFIYDIRDVSETGKIIAFILLGVLILIISFVYQKLKRLVTDNNETNEK